jgi:hypothetical protein
MSVDENALSDRLYADALAANLRVRDAFLTSAVETSWGALEGYVRERAKVYREELGATPAAGERAIEKTEKRWHASIVPEGRVRLITLLTNSAKSLLQVDGREMILRVDRDEPGREILRWRFISLALPPAILVAAATPRGSPSPAAVRLLHAPMAPDLPVAHQHVHHAAMMSFEELWASLRLRALLEPVELLRSLRDDRSICPSLHRGLCLGGTTEAEKRLAKKRPLERGRHMTEWGGLIRQAFVARRILVEHAYHTRELSSCSDPVCKRGKAALRSFIDGRTQPYHAATTPYPWPSERYKLLRKLRSAKTPVLPSGREPDRHRLLLKMSAEERGLLVRAFSYLRAAEAGPFPSSEQSIVSADELYEQMFLQYLRVKTAVFRLLVHPPGESGLRHFLDHFKQIKVYVPESALLRPTEHPEPGLYVGAVEHRVSPDDWPGACDRWDRENDARPEQAHRPERAWLIHFQRKPVVDGLPLYGAEIRQMDSAADRVVRALAAQPRRLRTLRGVDICGVEADQPLWVSAESLRYVRTRSSEIAGRRPELNLQPLRLTLHAGEDFGWLTSGVRAVAEPFHWKLIQRGDRLGHGIAITFKPEEWWKRKEGQVIEVKRFDRLLDLAFLAQYTARERTAEQDEWLLDQIRTTVEDIHFRRKLNTEAINLVETVKELWRSLGGRLTRRLIDRPEQGSSLKTHERWIHSYLWSRGLQKYAHEPIRLKVDDDRGELRITGQRNECDLLVIARKNLIREVARWQVCIESNPSSNLVVGGLDAMGASQDFLQRRPTTHNEQVEETLTWTISTDDPITFSTTLADEYAYAWAGMVLRKDRLYDPAYARALLDEAAATSMRTRFTIPREDQARTGKDTGKRRGNARSA